MVNELDISKRLHDFSIFRFERLKWLEKILGKAGLIAVRKFFGVILLAIAVKIFGSNIVKFGHS